MANPKKANENKTPADAKAQTAESSAPAAVDQPAGDPPADQTDAAAGAAPGDGTVKDTDSDHPADDEAEEADRTVKSKSAIQKKSPASGDKKTADRARTDKAIEDGQPDEDDPPPVDKKFEAVEKRKAEIMDRMGEIADDVAAHDEEINILRDESAELLLELYPQQGESDKHSVAVRGYLNASARERQHRKLAPARLKALLMKAGLAPIDAAYARARGRGMARPIRRAAKRAAAPAADQAKDAKPTKKAE